MQGREETMRITARSFMLLLLAAWLALQFDPAKAAWPDRTITLIVIFAVMAVIVVANLTTI